MSQNLIIFILVLGSAVVSKGDDGIKDNSFLIEEATNQDPGTVQFINSYQYSDRNYETTYTFTNEIPVGGQDHQLSYAIPYQKKMSPTENTNIGDVLLNYRYQLMNNEHFAVAPRVTLILPTGDYKKGQGNGAMGYQIAQAVSITLNEKWTNHWNMGFTYTPSAKSALDEKADLFGFNFGTSVVYELNKKFNFLCEFVMNSNESVTGANAKTATTTYLIVPGFRTAFDIGKETQIVPGLAALLGVGPSAIEHERGAFAYLSVESKLW